MHLKIDAYNHIKIENFFNKTKRKKYKQYNKQL